LPGVIQGIVMIGVPVHPGGSLAVIQG